MGATKTIGESGRKAPAGLPDEAVDFLQTQAPAAGPSVPGAAGRALRAAALWRAAPTARSPAERRGPPAGSPPRWESEWRTAGAPCDASGAPIRGTHGPYSVRSRSPRCHGNVNEGFRLPASGFRPKTRQRNYQSVPGRLQTEARASLVWRPTAVARLRQTASALAIVAGLVSWGGSNATLASRIRTVDVCFDPEEMFTIVAAARERAARMFETAEVQIAWRGRRCPANAIRVVQRRYTARSERPGALAYAMLSTRTVTLYYDRIRADVHSSLFEQLLAHVLVHEITISSSATTVNRPSA